MTLFLRLIGSFAIISSITVVTLCLSLSAGFAQTEIMTSIFNRKAHPDLAGALRAANAVYDYHMERVRCMTGEVAHRHEDIRNNPPKYEINNPPVGEYCTTLMINSAEIDKRPDRHSDKMLPKSLHAPYLGIAAGRGISASLKGAEALAAEMVKRAYANASSDKPIEFGTTNPRFTVNLGGAVDAGFTQAVQEHRTKNEMPIASQIDRGLLYATLELCFRNRGGADGRTLGQCVQAGKDIAALYLSGAKRN